MDQEGGIFMLIFMLFSYLSRSKHDIEEGKIWSVGEQIQYVSQT